MKKQGERLIKLVGVICNEIPTSLLSGLDSIQVFKSKNPTWDQEMFFIGHVLLDKQVPDDHTQWHLPYYNNHSPDWKINCIGKKEHNLVDIKDLKKKLQHIIRYIEDGLQKDAEIAQAYLEGRKPIPERWGKR